MTNHETVAARQPGEAEVTDALRLWHADAERGSPLAELGLVKSLEARDGANVRMATNHVLMQALQQLAQTRAEEANVLRKHFVEAGSVYVVARELGMAEPTLYRVQRRACRHLAEIIGQMERQFCAERGTALSRRLPPPTANILLGAEGHLETLSAVLLAQGPPWVVSIEGLGGIGKTALARQLACQLLRDEDPFIDLAWSSAQQHAFDSHGEFKPIGFAARRTSDLVEALAFQLLEPEVLPTPFSLERVQTVLQARLQRQPHLVVIDNLETLADVETLLPLLQRWANPTKFLLTSRETFLTDPDFFHFQLPEMDLTTSLALLRQEAVVRNLGHVVAAGDEALRPIYETVGGNPLALKLAAGQLYLRDLPQVVADLRGAGSKQIDDLYRFIFWQAWNRLGAVEREVLMVMPLFAESGADVAAIARACGQEGEPVVRALRHLANLSLVSVGGDLSQRRYSVHRLTEQFLVREIIQWPEAGDGALPGIEAALAAPDWEGAWI